MTKCDCSQSVIDPDEEDPTEDWTGYEGYHWTNKWHSNQRILNRSSVTLVFAGYKYKEETTCTDNLAVLGSDQKETINASIETKNRRSASRAPRTAKYRTAARSSFPRRDAQTLRRPRQRVDDFGGVRTALGSLAFRISVHANTDIEDKVEAAKQQTVAARMRRLRDNPFPRKGGEVYRWSDGLALRRAYAADNYRVFYTVHQGEVRVLCVRPKNKRTYKNLDRLRPRHDEMDLVEAYTAKKETTCLDERNTLLSDQKETTNVSIETKNRRSATVRRATRSSRARRPSVDRRTGKTVSRDSTRGLFKPRRVRAEAGPRTIRLADVVEKDFRKHVPRQKQPSVRDAFIRLSIDRTYGDTIAMGKVEGETLYRHRVGGFRVWFVIVQNEIIFLGVDPRDESTYKNYLDKFSRRYRKYLEDRDPERTAAYAIEDFITYVGPETNEYGYAGDDYEPAELQPDSPEVQRVEVLYSEFATAAQAIRLGEPTLWFGVNLPRDTVAMYVNGTSREPQIWIDVSQHPDDRELRLSVLHELFHAYVDSWGLSGELPYDYEEELVEEAAHLYLQVDAETALDFLDERLNNFLE